MLDPTNPHDAKIRARLEQAEYAFLITTRPDGRPHSVPICFLYENDSILVFSLPNSVKVRNIQQNPNVCLAVESFGFGDYFSIVIEGNAELVDEPTNWLQYPAYDAKYAPLSQRMFGSDHVPDEYAAQFSQAIRITPTKIRQDD